MYQARLDVYDLVVVFIYVHSLYVQVEPVHLHRLTFASIIRQCGMYHNTICFMTGENPVPWLAQFVFINLFVYLETGLNRSTS